MLALSGGVGGAKLAAGLAAVLPADQLTIAVNTADDFEHLGLTICPDIDSVTYALAGLNDTERGWGVQKETWQAMEMLGRLGEADWFNLGDRDMGMHIARSWRLRDGDTLSQVTARLTGELGIAHNVVPMSDQAVRTQVRTDQGWMDFQQYFVAEQCRPIVREIRFEGAPGAAPSPGFASALGRSDLAAVVICPSNPYLSVDPILAVDGVRDRLVSLDVPLIAVSPLIGGKALKGPLSKLLAELGKPERNEAIADHYAGLVSHLVIDESDSSDLPGLSHADLRLAAAQSIMRSAADREHLARKVLAIVGISVD